MAVRSGRKTSKRMGARRANRARRLARRRVARLANSEFASAKQTVLLNNDTVNTLYQLDNIQLQDFDRLSQIGEAYQYFRITRIEMRYKPFSDTFLPGNNSVPYFLWLIDRNENFNLLANAFQAIRSAGAKPRRFDDKMLMVSWKPSVLQTIPNDSLNPPATTTFMNSRLSPWLPTNRNAGGAIPSPYQPSDVPHRGIYYGVQQDLTAAAWQYGVEITVYCQFKKPNPTYTQTLEEGVQPAVKKSLKPQTSETS